MEGEGRNIIFHKYASSKVKFGRMICILSLRVNVVPLGRHSVWDFPRPIGFIMIGTRKVDLALGTRFLDLKSVP